MQRTYSSDPQDPVLFFVASEVEHSPAFGKTTLFVVGVQDVQHILALAQAHNAEHVYLGANMSFDPTAWAEDNTMAEQWHQMIKDCLDSELLVTLDFDVQHATWVIEGGYTEYNNFIPMISVRLPYIQLLGYNATIKLDDKSFNASNPGVWCHLLHDLQSRRVFTPWDAYKQDKII